MTWKLSRFRAGQWVEVRSKDEILATLDAQGQLDGMPFMPEMLAFCGQKMRVAAVAHKTCDTAKKTGGRKLSTTVHLEKSRCDGSAHGGCQAECFLFWKDAWLRPVNGPAGPTPPATGCGEAQLLDAASVPSEPNRYVCQTTKLHDATTPLRWWDIRQYFYDVWTGNHSLGHVISTLTLATLRNLLDRLPFGYRVSKRFVDAMHRILTGRPTPIITGRTPKGQRTPTGKLGLQPGETVRIRSADGIEKTIDADGKNRGLSFDPEMSTFCNGEHTVRQRVTKILDENTGVMTTMKEPCITLDDVVCRAEYSACRLMCPRAIPSYWREIWLERVEAAEESKSTLSPAHVAAP